MKNQNTTDNFIYVEHPEPHIGRAKQLLAKYPELRKLFGNRPSTAFHIFGLVIAQTIIAYFMREQSWWVILLAAWFVGAFINHALFVMIHECTHNLVLKGSVGNRWMGMISNFPIVFPAAMGFRTFHLLHHRHQGEFDRDADLAGPNEAKFVGQCFFRKSLWLLNFWFVEGVVRPARLKKVKLIDKWTILNVIVQLAYVSVIVLAFGWVALAYLFASTIFSVGLHPVGARWIQEHYVIVPNQETYSYYGPINKVCYNVGYHNEHHDLMMVPWSKLPEVKRMAPEFYDTLHAHQSWTKLLFQFLFTPSLNLYSRVTRPSRS